MGKLVPGPVSLPFLTLRKVRKDITSPCCQSFFCDRLGRVDKNLLVETTCVMSPQLASAPFQPLHSRVQMQNRVCFMGWRVGRGGQGGQRKGVGDWGQWPFLAVPRKQGLSPKHPAQAQWQLWPPALPGGFQTPMECLRVERVQARKTTKMMKNTMRMRKILTISHRLEVTDWKYLRISEWAASTSSWAPSTFSSIL